MKLKRGVMRAAEFVDLQWINTEPMSLESLRGNVVLVHFWDYSCINCLRALSYVKVWHGRYGDKGVCVLGVHAPEFVFGRERDNVARAVDDLGVVFPVASDPDFSTWHAYSNRYWPATYVVDQQGYLSDYQFGEGGYDGTERVVQTLLREGSPRVILPKVMEALRPEDTDEHQMGPVSPEVYLGFRRGRIGNEEGFKPGDDVTYAKPLDTVKDVFYAEGTFRNESDCFVHVGHDAGRILLSYDAVDVYLVAEPGDEGEQVFTVEQDGHVLAADEFGESVSEAAGGPRVQVNAPRLFHLVHNRDCARHRLVLNTRSSGLRFYCMSFVGITS